MAAVQPRGQRPARGVRQHHARRFRGARRRADIELSARIKGRLDDLRPAARAFLGAVVRPRRRRGAARRHASPPSGTPEQPDSGRIACRGRRHARVTACILRSPTCGSAPCSIATSFASILPSCSGRARTRRFPDPFPRGSLGSPARATSGRAALRGHLDDVTIKVLEPLVSADALGATDFNIRVEYSVEATAPCVRGDHRRRSCDRRRHPIARSQPRAAGRRPPHASEGRRHARPVDHRGEVDDDNAGHGGRIGHAAWHAQPWTRRWTDGSICGR